MYRTKLVVAPFLVPLATAPQNRRLTMLALRNIFLFLLIAVVLIVFVLFTRRQQGVEVLMSTATRGQRSNLKRSLRGAIFEGFLPEAVACLKRVFNDGWAEGSYHKLDKLTEKCTSRLFYTLPILRLGNPALEAKYFLPPLDRYDRCNVITLGVGTEIVAESELRLNLPQCTFLGADPDKTKNKELFESNLRGVFVQTAVGGTSGNYSGSFMTETGGYASTVKGHQGLEQFLARHNGMDQVIDLLLMDVEGAEFDIFDVIIGSLDKLPAICQFNVEIHSVSVSSDKKPRVVEQFSAMLLKSKFVPLKVDGTPYGFYRTYWLNYGDARCLNKYFGDQT